MESGEVRGERFVCFLIELCPARILWNEGSIPPPLCYSQGTKLNTVDGPAVVVRDQGSDVEAYWPECSTPNKLFSIKKAEVTRAAASASTKKKRKRM